MTPAVVGVANHNGWAHFVTIAWTDEEPVVVDRRRVTLVADDVPKQPHEHHARELLKPEAQALVDRVRRSAADHAHAALATLRDELAPVLTLHAMAMRRSQFGELPADIGEILDYPPFRYAADSMLYLEALEEAATALGLSVERHKKGDEFARAGARLGLDDAETEAWLRDLGPRLGPPWTEDHRRAAAAAIGVGQ